MKIYIQSESTQARLAEHLAALAECEQNHAYERVLEHYAKTLEYLQQLPVEAGLDDQKAALRNHRAELLLQLGRWDQAMEDIDRTLAAEGQLEDQGLVIRALVLSAQISSCYGDYNEAISTLERARVLAEPEGHKLELAMVCLELGTVFARIGEPLQGREKLEQVVSLLSGEALTEEEASVASGAYTQIGLAFFRERNVADAQQAYEESLRIARQFTADTKVEADTLRYLGILSNLQGQNADAIRYHRQALEIYHRRRLPLGKAKTYSSIGHTCLDMSRLDEALFFTHKAERLSRRLGADAEVAAIYGRLGNIYLQMGDFNRAVEFHLKDVEMCRRFGNYRAIAYAMHNLGLSYRGKGDIEEALHYLQESLQRFIELGDGVYAARLHLDIARCFMDRSRLAEAEEQIEETEAYLDAERGSAELGYARLLMGQLHRLWQNYSTAESSLVHGVEVLSAFGPSPLLAECHFELGMLFVEQGQPQKALGHLKESLRMSRKLEMRSVMLDSINQIERINEMELVNLVLEDVEQRSNSPFKARG